MKKSIYKQFLLFTSVLTLCFLFLTGCNLFEDDEAEAEAEVEAEAEAESAVKVEEENLKKLQKNSAFAPFCDSGYARCKGGAPACGTRVGSGKLEAYCINEKDIILEKEVSCDEYSFNVGKPASSFVVCEQIITSS